MKLDNLVGERFKERPADCAIDSHALMIRGGYMKYVANGIYSSYAALRRVTRKIEQIIREEMDAIGGQEVLFPVVMPASLWRESGRYDSVGHELARFRDRNDNEMVLGMTHEEASVQLAREYGQSYAKYPFMIYQVQTKFRDEPRPRGGLIRVREFTMKDGYSFHSSQESLDEYYMRCYGAYTRIFARAGIPDVLAVTSDSGMMGGSVSYEFMLLTPVGEDSIITCGHCGYRANMEAAENITVNQTGADEKPLTKVHTPGAKTMADVCGFLGLPLESSCKSVVYQKNADDSYIIVFIRGDLDVNETKLDNYVNEAIHPAEITDGSGLAAGFIGPYGLETNTPRAGAAGINAGVGIDDVVTGTATINEKAGNAIVLYDRSLEGAVNICCGANETDYHYTGFNIGRDAGTVDFHDFAKAKEGGICPLCGSPSLVVSRGVEVGHIFQLGDKYTKSMDMKYMDENGDWRYPLMGCYGIGVGRLAAAVCEARHDEFGPIWPVSIAPWHVHLCCVRADDPGARAAADSIYTELQASGVEVIYDDRAVSAGVMFADADLIGAPYRVIVSPRNLKEGCCEIISRDKAVNMKVKPGDLVPAIKELV